MIRRLPKIWGALLIGAGSLWAWVGISPAQAALSCTYSTTNLSFGTVDVTTNSQYTTTATLTVTCSGGTSGLTVRNCISLGSGSGGNSASGTPRYMSSNSLAYNIYTDAGYTTIWGSYTWNGAGGPGYEIDITLNASGAGSATKTLYGVIPAGQQSIVPGSASSSFSGLEKYINYGYTTAGTCLAEDLPSTSSTGGFTVSATVPTSCSVSVTTLDFGSMSSIPSNVDVAATISPTCTNTTPYSLGIDNGLNASGAQRRMRLGATSDYLNYNLYTNSGRTSGWLTTTSTTSCTSGASTCVLGTGTGSAQSVSVYGRLPPQTPTAAGTYTDTAIVTLTY